MPEEPVLGELGAPTLQVYIDAAGSNAKSRKHDQDGKEHFSKWFVQKWDGGFPGGAVVENLPANAGDTGSSPGLGRSHMPRSN